MYAMQTTVAIARYSLLSKLQHAFWRKVMIIDEERLAQANIHNTPSNKVIRVLYRNNKTPRIREVLLYYRRQSPVKASSAC
jgi:hypothetical protein